MAHAPSLGCLLWSAAGWYYRDYGLLLQVPAAGHSQGTHLWQWWGMRQFQFLSHRCRWPSARCPSPCTGWSPCRGRWWAWGSAAWPQAPQDRGCLEPGAAAHPRAPQSQTADRNTESEKDWWMDRRHAIRVTHETWVLSDLFIAEHHLVCMNNSSF